MVEFMPMILGKQLDVPINGLGWTQWSLYKEVMLELMRQGRSGRGHRMCKDRTQISQWINWAEFPIKQLQYLFRPVGQSFMDKTIQWYNVPEWLNTIKYQCRGHYETLSNIQ